MVDICAGNCKHITSSVAPLLTDSAPAQGSSTCLPSNQAHVRQKTEKTSAQDLSKVSEDTLQPMESL